MDAATYIEQFRRAAASRDSLATRALAARLRDEPWPTVALVTVRLTQGVSRRAEDVVSRDDAQWFHEHLTDVLVAAHARVKATREGV